MLSGFPSSNCLHMVIPFPGETEERNGQAEAGGWVPQGVRGREVRIGTHRVPVPLPCHHAVVLPARPACSMIDDSRSRSHRTSRSVVDRELIHHGRDGYGSSVVCTMRAHMLWMHSCLHVFSVKQRGICNSETPDNQGIASSWVVGCRWTWMDGWLSRSQSDER